MSPHIVVIAAVFGGLGGVIGSLGVSAALQWRRQKLTMRELVERGDMPPVSFMFRRRP